MTKTAQLIIDGKTFELPIVEGTLGDKAIDITRLRADSGFITYDPGYVNTGPCKSAITFVDGEQGILRYRGYPIEQLAERGSFTETAWLLIFGELPTRDKLSRFSAGLCAEELLHEDLRHHF
ncbi:MAG: citrate/2-methylcitrate synthase, partial [Humidesulfovibrio sp.]|nr:citrate/2-methylcitrate synthase [Humidesulfovibrio sp.]